MTTTTLKAYRVSYSLLADKPLNSTTILARTKRGLIDSAVTWGRAVAQRYGVSPAAISVTVRWE